MQKSNKTCQFVGYSCTSATPSIYTTQQLGLVGITKTHMTHSTFEMPLKQHTPQHSKPGQTKCTCFQLLSSDRALDIRGCHMVHKGHP